MAMDVQVSKFRHATIIAIRMTKPKLDKNIKFIVGIDEAGRGPLAGPVSVGGVVVSVGKIPDIFKEARDSKQISEARREEIFKKIKTAKGGRKLDLSVALVSAKIIDKKGITFAIRLAIKRVLTKLAVPPHETLVLLDGSLKAPEEFLFQKTIIRGDASEPIIGLASIVAKVTRDRRMTRLSKKYPNFDFHIHKGYGTLAHRKKIKAHGTTDIHRRSFLTKF